MTTRARPIPRQAPRPGARPLRRPTAVTWVGPRDAVLARRTPSGAVEVATFRRLAPIEDELTFLARVSHDIGPAADILVLGPADERLVFERIDVAIHQRPDRLQDGPDALPNRPTTADLAARLDS